MASTPPRVRRVALNPQPGLMDGHGDDGLQDLFSQVDPPLLVGGIDFFSQAEFSGAPHHGLQSLDLNSQAKEFPDLNSYSKMLWGEGAPRGHSSRTLCLRAPRNGGRGGGGGGRGSGGGRVGGGSRGADGNRGGGSKGHATRSLFVGSLPEGAAGSVGRPCGCGRGAGTHGGTFIANDGAPFGGEDWVDADEETVVHIMWKLYSQALRFFLELIFFFMVVPVPA